MRGPFQRVDRQPGSAPAPAEIYTEVEAIAYEDQRVIWDGQQLQDDRTLGQYGIPKEAVLHAVGRLRGD